MRIKISPVPNWVKRRPKSSRGRRGFTLLELLVVLILIALVTAVVTVRLQAPYQAARLEEALERVAFADSQTRLHASTFATACQLVIDLDQGRLYAQQGSDEQTRHSECLLPGALTIRTVLTPQREVTSGRLQIPISRRGTGATYAICLAPAHGAPRWLLFAGLTGRMSQPKDENHVRAILQLLASAGADAP